MNEACVEVQELSKRYARGTLAIAGITFSVARGELLAILGPNGSGKTTLTRMITTELVPTTGAIRIMNFDAIRNPERIKPFMGVVPQEAELFGHLTVAQHLYYFALFRGSSNKAAHATVDANIAELGLEKWRATPIRNLSGGLKRRVMLALALLFDPAVLVLDEPTAGLDPESRVALWDVLDRRRRNGAAILLTTHYLEEAERLANRIAVLNSGRLVVMGEMSVLRARAGTGADADSGLAEVYFRLMEQEIEKIS